MTVVANSTATKPKDTAKPVDPKPNVKTKAVDPKPETQPFGIRSYIDQFYDWSSPKILEETEGWYLIPPTPKNRRVIFLFRILTIIGIILLVNGAIGIMVGYMWPKETIWDALKKHKVERNEQGELLVTADLVNELSQDHMKPWKLAGLITFALGGCVLAVSLLIPSCAKVCGNHALNSEVNSPMEPPIKIFPASDEDEKSKSSQNGQGSAPTSPTQKMVPSIEQVTQVQPSEEKLRRTSQNEDAMLVDEK